MSNLKTILDACLRARGFDFTIKSRKREYVYSRAALYKVCRLTTKESLESIGKLCGKDHASVLHVTGKKGMHFEYLLTKEYRAIFELFRLEVGKVLSLKNESEIETYYDDLNYKIETLDNENKELRNDIYKLKENPIEIVLDPTTNRALNRIINKIKGLTDETLEDLEKYRLDPYLKLQESKINH